METLDKIIEQAKKDIDCVSTLARLNEVRSQYLGKKGKLTELFKHLGTSSVQDRPKLGQAINAAKDEINDLLVQQKSQLQAAHLFEQLTSESIDVSLPARGEPVGKLHPVTQVMHRIEKYFVQMGFNVVSGPEIENEYYNFDALNMPKNHPARDPQDTFYLQDGYLLRTHTSSSQIRYLEQQSLPIKMLSMGRVYRRDSDVSHTPMFHQSEGLLVDKDISFANLKAVLSDFISYFFEDESLSVRFRPSFFPFTEPSAELDIACMFCSKSGKENCRICKDTGWIEVLGCGMVHPNVLKYLKNYENNCRGFAFGMGIDRLAMLYYQINDLRLLFENDLSFLEQF